MNTRSRSILVAALSGALALPAVLHAEEKASEKLSSELKDSDFQCWGINACKGMGACSATGRREDGCHGSNACRRQGFLRLDPETCGKIEGGRLTKEAKHPARKSGKAERKAEG